MMSVEGVLQLWGMESLDYISDYRGAGEYECS